MPANAAAVASRVALLLDPERPEQLPATVKSPLAVIVVLSFGPLS